MGVGAGKIEMLFVSPDYFGKGVGRQLADLAISQYAQQIIAYLQQCWSSISPIIYSDCVNHCIEAVNPLPQWYVLEKDGEFIGCAGLITNNFISRMDLYPWLCALFIDENHRGHNYGLMLIEKTKEDARKFGFANMYLSTEHIGYYEKYGFI